MAARRAETLRLHHPLLNREPAVTEGPQSTEGEEHFKPTGTIFILAMFLAALILLWASVYVILLSRGVTV